MKLKIGELKRKQSILQKVDLSVNDKLTYCIKKIYRRIEDVSKEPLHIAQEAIADFTVAQASVDEKGILIVIDDKYSFTPKSRQAVQRFVSEETFRFEEAEVEIEPCRIVDTNIAGYERVGTLFDDFDRKELTGLLF